jgi:2-oxoglutarate ferredoxin oxidoreductase subunit alpha
MTASTAPRELVDGATAIVRGALDAGCTFFAGYPITPASSILAAMMRELPKAGGVAIQGEDEIASIGMCLGAAMAGARAMTATSGPGISLYSENVGLAIMGEIPLVIVDAQRLGPATGGATTVAQGDVQFVRWGTSGGYPIIALAPSSIPECYTLTLRAFDLAERFRTPVFLVTDKELNLTSNTVAVDGYARVPVRERRSAKSQANRHPPSEHEHMEVSERRRLVRGEPRALRISGEAVPVVGHEDPGADPAREPHGLPAIEVAHDALLLAEVIASVDRQKGDLDPHAL